MKNLIQSILILATMLSLTTGAEEVIYAQVGDKVTLPLPRNAKGDYVYWYFGRTDETQLAWRNNLGGQGKCKPEDKNCAEKWEEKVSLPDTSLIITDIQQENFGTFVGKVGEKKEVAVTINVLKLTVTMVPATPLLPGESVTLSCNADRHPKQKNTVIHWLNPQGVKINGKTHTERATEQSNGQWTCVVTNDAKVNEAKVFVRVVDLSPVPSPFQYTSKSTPLTIPCSISSHISWEHVKAKGIEEVYWDFFPKPGSNAPQRLFTLPVNDTLIWKEDQGRGLKPVADPKKGNLSLTRTRGREEDRGDYVCFLKFKNGAILNRTVHVYVLQIISFPSADLISGQQVNVTCSIGHPLSPDLQLKLIQPEQSQPPLTSYRDPAHLTIPEVGTGDDGKWSCELWQSNTRLTSTFIKLKIDPKLSVWMLVIICSVTVIVVLLLILVCILCRRRQRKMRHLRHRLCQCKNPKPKGFYRT